MQDKISVDITIPNQTKYLSLIGRISENLAYAPINFNGDRDELAFHLNLVLTEAATNAICHGHQADPSKQLRISMAISETRLTLKVYDTGCGFDIDALAAAEAKETDEQGRGIQLIYRLMDQVRYLQQQNVNILEMTKYLH